MSPTATDTAFFAALADGDAARLRDLLTGDFVLIDVVAGGVIAGADLVDVVDSGTMVFEAIEPTAPPLVRSYGDAAVIVGQTAMRGRLGDTPFSARSRYTHVFVRQAGGWRLASAQGTRIQEGA